MEKNLVGKTWSMLTESEKESLLLTACATEKEGDCIIDFEQVSIAGKVVVGEFENTIEIADDATFYNPIA